MAEYDHRRVIAIDGPAAAGKSTVALALANHLGALLFDTGALYRTVTLAALRRGLPLDDAQALADLTASLKIELKPPTVNDGRVLDVLLDGEDVTWAIRTPEIDADVSQVSAHQPVRQNLLGVQRSIADGALVVMVGRDIGTIVTPNAGTKIFLDASAEERARRRVLDLQAQGTPVEYETVLAEIIRRDHVDSTREVAPLAASPDAVHIMTDGHTIEEIVSEIQNVVEQHLVALGVH